VSDSDWDGFLPQALEQEWTVKFVMENLSSLPTEWLYASLAVCEANPHLLYSAVVSQEIENELSQRKSRHFH